MMMELPQKSEYRFLTTLCTIFVTTSLISVAVGYKLVAFKSFIFSGAAFILPFRYLLGDVITEVYGYQIGKKQIINLFLCCLLFSIGVTLIIALPSPAGWPYESAYQTVLGASFKITAAALFAVVIGGFINIYFLIKLRFLFNSFALRALMATWMGELIQYVIVLTILYYPTLSLHQLIKLIMGDYVFQILFIAVLTIPMTLLMSLLKKTENIYSDNFLQKSLIKNSS